VKENLLKISELTYKYDTRSVKGIDSLSFYLQKNECVSIIGPSGSGKSTALSVIAGLLKPQKGTVDFIGEQVLAYVPQSTELPKDKTVLEILKEEITEELDDEKRENQARTTLALLNITNEINSKTQEISGGQKQRLIIAKALVKNPTIILLDEPFGHLDEKLRFDLMNELFELFKSSGISVLWVTHETSEALAFSTRLLVLNHGKLMQEGTCTDVYERPKNLFTAQFMGRTNTLITKVLDITDEVISTKLFSRDITIPKPSNFHLKDHKDLILLIKPEIIKIEEDGRFKGKVQKQIYQGAHFLTQLEVAGEQKLWLYTDKKTKYPFGKKVNFSIDLSMIHALDEL